MLFSNSLGVHAGRHLFDRPVRKILNGIRFVLFSLLLGSMLGGCNRNDAYPNRPITLTCPWAAGGGTDLVSRQMAVHLEHELGVPVNVINATGGKGVTGHRRGLRSRADGYTLAMITLELNTMHWSGLTNLTYKDCRPLMSVNEDYAALFVRNDSPWKSLAELEDHIRQHPGEMTASGTTAGGAWHLAMAGWLIACDMSPDAVKWISETGAKPSLEQLNSGGVDIVCCSLPEARAMYQSGQARALGVMAPERATGFEDVPTLVEQGNDWSLGGWRGLALPLGTPDHVHQALVQAIDRIVKGESKLVTKRTDDTGRRQEVEQTFPEFMAAQGFNNTSRGPEEFAQFMAETDEKFGKLLNNPMMSSVNAEPFHPMTFPYILFGLLALTVCGLVVTRCCRTTNVIEPLDADGEPETISALGIFRLAVVIGCVVMFALFSEQVGFVILGGVFLLIIFCALGTRLWQSVLYSVLIVPVTYQLFAVVLRVPLPRGWFGW